MANIQKYGEFTPAAADETAAQIASGGNFFKASVGKNKIRVLPPPVGQQKPWVIAYEHRVELPGAKVVNFCCPRVMAKSPCPVCAKADEFARTGNQADRDRAQELRPRMRAYMCIIDRKAPEKGVQVFGTGKTVVDAMIKIRKDEDIGGNFTDPVKGFDLIIERVGTGKNDTEYSTFPSKAVTQLCQPGELDDLLASAPDLGRYVRVKSVDEIKGMLSGETDDAAVDVGKGSTKGRSAQDDIEQDPE